MVAPNEARQGLDINPDRWPEVSRVFAAALGLDGAARHAYLDDACGQDRSLRNAVDSLLGAHDAAGSFDGTSVFEGLAPARRLQVGSQLGPFVVDSLLGVGGMGEVYRAHDTKLRRDVALKVLPDSVAHNPDRRARFSEEALALAALNHPHIGAIYGVEESGADVALVLELVDGPTLAERLTAGRLAVDEIVRIARQLAEGLEAAHERGIVHRDLKPGNVKITREGEVKILDFGLAKLDGAPATAMSPGSPPVARDATGVGIIVGTAGYMSPEQALGQRVDRRTDIWAFGCVLFEMCAGRPAFTGATVRDTLRAVIEQEPDWTALRDGTPAAVARLLRRCLTRDSRLRLRDIGEARIALAAGQESDPVDLRASRARRRAALVAGAGALALAASVAVALYRPSVVARPIAKASPVRFLVPLPDGYAFMSAPGLIPFALSPDGSQLALLLGGGSPGQAPRIWVRGLADLEARPVAGTDNAVSPFWSPDGRSLGFFTDGKLKRVDLGAGGVVTICDLPGAIFSHGTWSKSGVILIERADGTAILSVPASGGTPRTVITRSGREVRIHWPWFLPDGQRFVYTARLDTGDGELRLGRLDGTTRPLVRASSNAQWVDPDVIVFARDGVLMGQHVDPDSARPVGEPFSVASPVEYFFTTSRAMFSVSHTGALAYHTGGALQQLTWVDRSGRDLGALGAPADYFNVPRLSRDGRKMLVAIRQPDLGTSDIWKVDLERNTRERLTVNPGTDSNPMWTEGERGIVYNADSPGSVPHLFRMDVATGRSEELLPPGTVQIPTDELPGDMGVAFVQINEAGHFALFRMPPRPGATPVPLLESPYSVLDVRVSPDGRAMAYISVREERDVMYVAPLPPTTAPELVAEDAGPPHWSADGRQIYFAAGGRVMTVPVSTAPHLTLGTPSPLFELKSPGSSLVMPARDGRFLILVPLVEPTRRPLVVSTAGIDSKP